MGKEQVLNSLLAGDRLPIDTYQNPLKFLGGVSKSDIANLRTAHLSRMALKISRNILEILLNEGQPEKIEDEHCKALRLLDEPLGGSSQRINVFLLDNSQIDKKDLYLVVYSQDCNPGEFSLYDLRPNYELTLPAEEGILDLSRLQANDWRGGKHYWPVYYPEDLAEQKGFFQILQRGIKDLLSVLPQQTKVPKVFSRAFKGSPRF